MNNLELKVPPLLLFLIVAGLMMLTSLYLPSLLIGKNIQLALSALFMITGASFAFGGVQTFKKSKTTTNPMKPQATSTLVIHGIYKISRNPMYVGLLMLLIGWALFLSNLYVFAFPVGFVLYMNLFQIKPEERFLALKFPAEFEAYKKRVRRWL